LRAAGNRSRLSLRPWVHPDSEGDMPTLEGNRTAKGLRFAVVVARFNDFVTDRLLAGALEALTAADIDSDNVTVLRVPGSFEIPIAAQHAAETGRFAAVISLGCLIRGETPHFEYIAQAVSHGLTHVAAATGVPITFGVLTTNSAEEALARVPSGPGNKGWEAAMAAVEMATLLARLGDGRTGAGV
jgi:6,7-dimethyl-8-ribityllumazine synthase